MLKTGFPWHTSFHNAVKDNEIKLKDRGFLLSTEGEQGSYTCGCDLFGACERCGTTCKHWPCTCDEPEYCTDCGNSSKDCQCMNPEFWRETSALSVQTGGSHYKDKKIQPVEYAHANNLGFMEANVVKYITRHKDKNKAQDISKAIHYCQLILELEYGEKH